MNGSEYKVGRGLEPKIFFTFRLPVAKTGAQRSSSSDNAFPSSLA